MSIKKRSRSKSSEPSEADAFGSLLGGLLAVPHKELKEAMEREKADKKIKSSASARGARRR